MQATEKVLYLKNQSKFFLNFSTWYNKYLSFLSPQKLTKKNNSMWTDRFTVALPGGKSKFYFYQSNRS